MRDYLQRVLEANVKERREEGCDVELPGDLDTEALLRFIEALEIQRVRDGYVYDEPNDLSSIRSLATGWEQKPSRPDEATIRNKILGGWLGRVAGCRLGRPIEGTPLGIRADNVREFLQQKDLWPVTGFFHIDKPYAAYDSIRPAPFAGMIRDDDIDFAILNLLLVEQFGIQWSFEDARTMWLRHLTHDFIWAAGREAYTNFAMGMLPPATATWGNGFRQSLGGMIRCDVWGWLSPGAPCRAAELAHRDASISQTKNGLYAAMFVAAIIASAFNESDLHRLVQAGLAQIPTASRLAEAVRFTVDAWDGADTKPGGGDDTQYGPPAAVLEQIYKRYGDLYFNHSIINCVLVILGLFSGRRDFGRTITDTVLSGYDADCTGATAGSIMGVILGADEIPRNWIDPLHDTCETFLSGYGLQHFSNLAERTAKLALGSVGNPENGDRTAEAGT